MLEQFMPKQFIMSVFEIDLQQLQQQGIKAIITDLDNTLVEWDRPEPTERIREWVSQVHDIGMELLILSNNDEERVARFAKPLHLPYVYDAGKPGRKAFAKALKVLQLPREACVVVGDQVMTDVWGANRFGLEAILVKPVANNDAVKTRFNRQIERLILYFARKRGWTTWTNQ